MQPSASHKYATSALLLCAMDLTHCACITCDATKGGVRTFAHAIRAVLTRMVTSGRLRSPSEPKSNSECIKSTFSARVAEQRRANAHLSTCRYAGYAAGRVVGRYEAIEQQTSFCRLPPTTLRLRQSRPLLNVCKLDDASMQFRERMPPQYPAPGVSRLFNVRRTPNKQQRTRHISSNHSVSCFATCTYTGRKQSSPRCTCDPTHIASKASTRPLASVSKIA